VTDANNPDCGPNNAHGGTHFWCDGSVEGYDAVYQQLNRLTVNDTYNIRLGDNSGQMPTESNPNFQIDMLVYAGDSLPVGSIPIGTVPRTGTLALFGSGLLGLAGTLRRKLPNS
jgi:hypothetical protein